MPAFYYRDGQITRYPSTYFAEVKNPDNQPLCGLFSPPIKGFQIIQESRKPGARVNAQQRHHHHPVSVLPVVDATGSGNI
jgi:hypothetical protein